MNLNALIPFIVPVLLIAAVIASVVHTQKHIADGGVRQMHIWAHLIRFEHTGGETCRIVFEDCCGKRFRLTAPASVLDTIQENSTGSLCYQGCSFISFTVFS